MTRTAALFGRYPAIGTGWEKGVRISAFRFAAAVIALLVQGFGSTASNAGSAGLEDPDNWPQYHRTHDAWRFSPLTQINRDTVKRLKVAWIHQPGDITQQGHANGCAQKRISLRSHHFRAPLMAAG